MHPTDTEQVAPPAREERNGQWSERLTMEELTRSEFSKLHVLRRVSLPMVWGLLERCPVIVMAAGATLIEKGQSNQTMYLVLSGKLSVHLESESSEPVAILDRGQTVGEISVIDDSPATAHVRASQATRLLAVDEETFWRLVEVSHEFATNMLLLLTQRLRANNSRIAEALIQRRELEHEATVDALTGLRNRRWLENNLSRIVQRRHFDGRPMTVMMVDVDHFKRFNDTYGHLAGDRVLTAVARVIMGRLRPTDLAARYGGEEFVVILPDTPLSGAVVAAERLREAVFETGVDCLDGRRLPPVSISIGIAELEDDETPEALITRADAALYRAKESGRNRVVA